MTQPNPTTTIPTNLLAKHDIHKFWDIRAKLGKDNWISWKRELLATARDRSLYASITGKTRYQYYPCQPLSSLMSGMTETMSLTTIYYSASHWNSKQRLMTWNMLPKPGKSS